MGELYGNTDNEVVGFIKTLTYTVDQTSPWETEKGARVPRNISATISYQVIHSKVPQLTTDETSLKAVPQQFYGFGGTIGFK
jgi:ABC-type taurine transport system substrate-binding protein